MQIDGVEKPYFRADYVLRAAQIPVGNHTIKFDFHPTSYYTGEKISLAGSIFLIIALGGAAYSGIKKSKEEAAKKPEPEPKKPEPAIKKPASAPSCNESDWGKRNKKAFGLNIDSDEGKLHRFFLLFFVILSESEESSQVA